MDDDCNETVAPRESDVFFWGFFVCAAAALHVAAGNAVRRTGECEGSKCGEEYKKRMGKQGLENSRVVGTPECVQKSWQEL